MKIMNKLLLAMAALVLGLLFYCPETLACEDLGSAGFEAFLNEIKPEPKLLPHYILTDEDADLLLRVGVLEGGCDGVDGIAHVMQVVLNRFESDAWPNTVEGVLRQSGQFTTASKLASANVTPEAYAALDCVIFGDYLWNECYYFESLDGLAFDAWADYSFSYGGHDFYM